MKIVSPLPHKKGRIEIIPLIDIMFFLLAAFMIVSINKIRINSLKVSLPTDVPAAVKEPKEDFIAISVNASGDVQVDKTAIASKEQFTSLLRDLYTKNPEQKFLVSGDREARLGDVVLVLGKVRQVGFQRVAFAIKNEGGTNASGSNSLNLAPPSPSPTAPSAPAVPDPAAAPAHP